MKIENNLNIRQNSTLFWGNRHYELFDRDHQQFLYFLLMYVFFTFLSLTSIFSTLFHIQPNIPPIKKLKWSIQWHPKSFFQSPIVIDENGFHYCHLYRLSAKTNQDSRLRPGTDSCQKTVSIYDYFLLIEPRKVTVLPKYT